MSLDDDGLDGDYLEVDINYDVYENYLFQCSIDDNDVGRQGVRVFSRFSSYREYLAVIAGPGLVSYSGGESSNQFYQVENKVGIYVHRDALNVCEPYIDPGKVNLPTLVQAPELPSISDSVIHHKDSVNRE